MSCDHCISLRNQINAICARHGHEGWPPPRSEAERDVLDEYRRDVRMPSPGEVGDCACDCHAAARFCGVLPRLAVPS